jgi:hypothetical protein
VASHRLLLVVMLVAVFVTVTATAIVLTVTRATRGEAYMMAVALACRHPAVAEALGAPVKQKRFGPIRLGTGGSGPRQDGEGQQAVIMAMLAGANHSGILGGTATKTTGTWEFCELDLLVLGTARNIDLLGMADRETTTAGLSPMR